MENGWKDSIFVRMMEEKSYELTNHLGNVHLTLSDYRRKEADGLGVAYYSQINSASDYYPFGSMMPGRNFNPGEYRYGGAGGQEMDNEIAGIGNSYTAEFWQYDSRLGRRWNTDPVVKPWESSYAAFSNNPVFYNDPSGAQAEGPGDEGDPQKRTIEKGETLTSIAEETGTTVDELVELNNIEDPNRIIAGEELLIPGSTTNTESESDQMATDFPTLPSGRIESVSLLDVPIILGGALIGAGLEAMGMNEESSTVVASASVIVFSAIRGNPKRVIKGADDLIEAGGKMIRGKGGVRRTQNPVVGNADEVFETITKGGTRRQSGAIQMPDGTIIKKYPSTTTGGMPTIKIDKSPIGGGQFKIRIKPQQ